MRFRLLPLSVILAMPCWASSVQITTTSVPNGTADTAYSASVQANGGCTPYRWAITSGALPIGVAATPSTSTTSLNLAGTPITATTYAFSVQVTSCRHRTATASYDIVIQAAPNHVVDLHWNASTSTDVAGYNVYRAPDGVNWKKMNLGLITSMTYIDSTVANGSSYYYAATTVDIYGKESAKTATIKVVIP